MDWPNLTWAAPGYAWLLLLAAPAALLCRRAAELRRRDLLRLVGEGGVAVDRHWPIRLVLAAVFLLLVAALCRPQWGEVAVQQQVRRLDILIALDVSRSMLADDLSPNRLAVAKQAVAGLLPRLEGDRVGLIAFAGSAFLVCPLTRDYATFAAVLEEAGPDSLPLGGSALASALAEAGRAFAGTGGRGKVLIVISDGEDHMGGDAELAAAAQALQRAGVAVHAVAVGTLAGGLIPLAAGEFLRDREGAIVKSRLQVAPLRTLASGTGGRTLDLARDPQALATLHASVLSGLERQDTVTTRKRLAERFQLPLALALVLLMIQPLLGRPGP